MSKDGKMYCIFVRGQRDKYSTYQVKIDKDDAVGYLGTLNDERGLPYLFTTHGQANYFIGKQDVQWVYDKMAVVFFTLNIL